MAPRRGGGSSFGGSSGGSSDPACPGFLRNDIYASIATPIVYFIAYCLFLLLTLGVLVYTCCVRKRANKLIRLLFVVLAFMALGWTLVVIGTVLRECWVLPSRYDYYNFAITFTIFFSIGQWVLLFIQVWGVNRMLSQRLGSGQAVIKVVTLAIVGVMAALTAGYTGLICYNAWQTMASWNIDRNPDIQKYYDQNKLVVAYYVLYLLSVIAGGAISVAQLMKIRSKSIAVNDIMKRSVALTFCMLLWVIFELVVDVRTLEREYLETQSGAAMYYLNSFFQIFSYLAIVSLCKSAFWNENATQAPYQTTGYDQPAYAPVQPPAQNQYAYNGHPGQQYHYAQQPVYNGAPAPVNGNGHMVQVK